MITWFSIKNKKVCMPKKINTLSFLDHLKCWANFSGTFCTALKIGVIFGKYIPRRVPGRPNDDSIGLSCNLVEECPGRLPEGGIYKGFLFYAG